MFKLKVTHIRKTVDTPFFGDSSSESTETLTEFSAVQQMSKGFVQSAKTFSQDNLTMTVITEWESKADFKKFKTDNAALIEEIRKLRSDYHKANNIKRTISVL